MTAAATATPERIDERGARYAVDVEDTATTLVELASGACGTLLNSWATRVRRDDLLTFQIDGSQASAVAGLHRCWMQSNAQAPRTAHFSIAVDLGIDYRAGWNEVDLPGPFRNPYRVGWENFLRHVAGGAPMSSDLAAGIRDVAFAEACQRSSEGRGTWVRRVRPSDLVFRRALALRDKNLRGGARSDPITPRRGFADRGVDPRHHLSAMSCIERLRWPDRPSPSRHRRSRRSRRSPRATPAGCPPPC